MQWIYAVAVVCCMASGLALPAVAQIAGLDSVTRYLTAEMKRQQIPGLSVAILRGDRVVLARGFGFSNLEHRVPASDSTIYQSGSLGKQFTGALVGMLAQQGRLKVTDPITKWLPEGSGVWDSVTVYHLLTHTSGIPEYTDSLIDYRKDYTEDQLVRLASSQQLDFPPGESWSYSNTGYLLLGVLVHRVTGSFYGDLLRDLLFSPLAMRTRIISEADIVPNRAAGYRLDNNRIRNQEWVSPSLNTTADGSLYFSVNDLAKWAVALNRRRLPPAEVLAAAWTPVRLNGGGTFPYGYGWDLTEQRGHTRIGHTGSWQGFKTAFYRYPGKNLSVIVLANLSEATPGALAEGVAGILEPELRPPQLFAGALVGENPPIPAGELLKRVMAGRDSGIVTTDNRRFLRPPVRKVIGEMVRETKSWTELGCERVTEGKIRRLGAEVARICYARGPALRGRTVAAVYYTEDWQAAYLSYESY